MKSFVLKRTSRVSGALLLPGDKSIAHRAAILSAISAGKTTISNFPANQDCLATAGALSRLGVQITSKFQRSGAVILTVRSKGFFGLKKPKGLLYARESGTTIRLLAGLLAGQDFKSRLTCGKALSRRPMRRVCDPLRLMGARIQSRTECVGARAEEYPPLAISGGPLTGATYALPVASAQVKSAVLLAGLYAQGTTCVIESAPSRDHTERMLKKFKARIKISRGRIVLKGGGKLVSPGHIEVPADISSAAFFIVLASIVGGSLVELRNTGLNPSRLGILRVLKRMGADITVQVISVDDPSEEPAGDIFIRSAGLKGIVIGENEVPFLIDEIPVLMVAAAMARGRTVIKGAQELRVKETDRIRSMSENLSRMGVEVMARTRGRRAQDLIIEGAGRLRGARVKSFGDHRTAMSMVVAGAAAQGTTRIDDVSCINKSFPGFIQAFKSLIEQ